MRRRVWGDGAGGWGRHRCCRQVEFFLGGGWRGLWGGGLRGGGLRGCRNTWTIDSDAMNGPQAGGSGTGYSAGLGGTLGRDRTGGGTTGGRARVTFELGEAVEESENSTILALTKIYKEREREIGKNKQYK